MITKELRKQVGLPITKDLVYYRHVSGKEYQKFDVSDIKVGSEYSGGCYQLKITLAESLLNESEEVNILSDFFVHMQKLSFIRDMLETPNE